MEMRIMMAAGVALAGSLTFGAIEIPSEGLLFDLDATETSTLQTDASGYVTNWASSCSDVNFRLVDAKGAFLDPTAFGNRGALVFGRDADNTMRYSTRYCPDVVMRNQTVFMVLHWTRGTINGAPQMGELYGQKDQDSGIRGDYYNRMYTWGDSLIAECVTWFNGVKQTKRSAAYKDDVIPGSVTDVGNEPYVYCVLMTNDVIAAQTGKDKGTYKPQLCGYSQYSDSARNKRFFVGHLAEVIVYDRQLTEAEVDYVNDVLMHKWYGTEPKHPFVTVTGSPVEAGAPTPAYGKYMKGEHATTFSMADELETDPRDGARIVTADKSANQRTVYKGYEVVDSAGQVLQSSETDETFVFASDEAVTVRWKFDKDCNVGISIEGEGTVRVNGKSTAEWVKAGDRTKLEAEPADGWHFAYWKGSADGLDVLADRQHLDVKSGVSLVAVFEKGEPEYPKVLSRGLCYRVDASDAASCLYDADKYVTNWYSRVGDLSFDVVRTPTRPHYAADGMNGKGGVRFGLQKDASTYVDTAIGSSVSPGSVRTVALAFRHVKAFSSMFYIAGYTGPMHNSPENYLLSSIYIGGLYAQGYLANAWAWMDDGNYRQYPGHTSGATTDMVCQWDKKRSDVHTLIVEDGVSGAPDPTRPWSFGNANGNPTQYDDRCFPGDIGESLGYSRPLAPAEARYMIAYLNRKWKDEPFAMDKIANGSGIVISADTTYENLLLKDTPTVTVAAGKSLKVRNLLVQEGDVAFVVEAGATLEIPEIVRYDAADVVTFTLNDGTLVLCEPGEACRYNNEQNVYDRLETVLDGQLASDAVLPALRLPGVIAGTGRLVKRGARPLVLSQNDVFPDGLAYSFEGGTVDLNGRSLVAATVEGPAKIVNSAAVPVTLTVGRDTAFALESRVVGNIGVVRQGAGAMTLVDSASTGALTLSAGVNKVNPCLMTPGAIPGLGCHLDASRPDSMVLNESGEVVEWRSLSGDGGIFRVKEGPSDRMPTTYFTYRGPMYSATAFNGKPGLLFSQNETGQSLACTNSLFGNMAYRANTMVAVVRPHKNPSAVGSHWGHIWAESNYGASGYSSTCLKIAHWQSDGYKYWHWGSEANPEAPTYRQMMVNGKVILDAKKEIRVDDLLATSWVEQPTVVAFTVNGNCTFTPAVGSLCDHVRSFRGVISEIAVYNRILTEEELVKLESALMAKWGIDTDEDGRTAFDSMLSSESSLVLGKGATLDLGGVTNVVGSLTYAADCSLVNGALKPAQMIVIPNPSGFLPLLTVTGGLDVTDCDLEFASDPQVGTFIRATGGLVGPFKSETGNSTPAVVTPRKARIGANGFCLLVM